MNKLLYKLLRESLMDEDIETDYRRSHTAPDKTNGVPLHELADEYVNQFGTDVVYSRKAQYIIGGARDEIGQESLNMVKFFKDKPDAFLTIYRAVPKVITNYEKLVVFRRHRKYMEKYNRLPPKVDNWLGVKDYGRYLSKEIPRLESVADKNEKIDINDGDWVCITMSCATNHGSYVFDDDYRILKKRVTASQVYSDTNDIREFGYVEYP